MRFRDGLGWAKAWFRVGLGLFWGLKVGLGIILGGEFRVGLGWFRVGLGLFLGWV